MSAVHNGRTALNLTGLDLNLLVVFDALLREQNVTRAAEHLHLSQSAASRALARLRDVLADPLLVRTSQGMVPTARARELAGPVRRILSEVRDTLALRPPFDPASAKAVVQVSLPDVGQALILPALLAELSTSAPGVVLLVHPRFTGTDQRALERGEIDVVLSSPGAELMAGLFCEHLLTLHHVSIVRSDHPAAADDVSLDAFCAWPHVVVGSQGLASSETDRLLAELGKSRRVALRMPSYLAIPAIVKGSNLVATIPELLLHVAGAGDGLVKFTPPVKIPETRIGMIWHERTHYEPVQAWFRSLLSRVCARVFGPPA
jgi:DNA-binding transcriptional LysR family regulator